MTRGRGKAAGDKSAADHPAAKLRGKDAAGNVRPADNRYLTGGEIAMRDAFVAEETGEEAQQLIVKREAPEHVERLNGSGRIRGRRRQATATADDDDQN